MKTYLIANLVFWNSLAVLALEPATPGLLHSEPVECTFSMNEKTDRNTYKGVTHPAKKINKECRFKAQANVTRAQDATYKYEILKVEFVEAKGTCAKEEISAGKKTVKYSLISGQEPKMQIPLTRGEYRGSKSESSTDAEVDWSWPEKIEVQALTRTHYNTKFSVRTRKNVDLSFGSKAGGFTLQTDEKARSQDYAPHYRPSVTNTKSVLICRSSVEAAGIFNK